MSSSLSTSFRSFLSRNTAGFSQVNRYITTELSSTKPFSAVPGPKSLPFIGTVWTYLPGGPHYGVPPDKVAVALFDKYGPIVRETICNQRLVHVFLAEDIETIYRNDGKYPNRPVFGVLQQYNKNEEHSLGLFTSNDEEWRQLRSKLQTRLLHPAEVTIHLKDQVAIADEFVQTIAEMRDEEGDVQDLLPELYKYMSECMALLCFGLKLGVFKTYEAGSDVANFLTAIDTIFEVTLEEVHTLPLYRIVKTQMYKRLEKAMASIRMLAEKCAVESDILQKQTSDVRSDGKGIMGYLMEKHNATRSEAISIVTEFMFASIDSVSHLLAFLLHMLSKTRDAQIKLISEIDHVCARKSEITSDDISKMPYLKAVIKEGLRMQPINIANIRKVQKDIVCGGYHIPKDTFAIMQVDWTKDRDTYFENAKLFMPERWLGRSIGPVSAHPFSYLPFGFGPRSCLGKRLAEQEASVLLIKIFQKYRVEYHGGELGIIAGITVKPAQPLKFRFVERVAPTNICLS